LTGTTPAPKTARLQLKTEREGERKGRKKRKKKKPNLFKEKVSPPWFISKHNIHNRHFIMSYYDIDAILTDAQVRHPLIPDYDKPYGIN